MSVALDSDTPTTVDKTRYDEFAVGTDSDDPGGHDASIASCTTTPYRGP